MKVFLHTTASRTVGSTECSARGSPQGPWQVDQLGQVVARGCGTAVEVNVGEDLDAASAAYRVGYQNASHFNREYKSLFGVPPMRDVQRLRDEAQSQASR